MSQKLREQPSRHCRTDQPADSPGDQYRQTADNFKCQEYEQYYSQPDVARRFRHYLENEVPPCELYVEPGVGKGALFRQLPADARLGLDIQPRFEDPCVFKCDFASEEAQSLVRERIRKTRARPTRPRSRSPIRDTPSKRKSHAQSPRKGASGLSLFAVPGEAGPLAGPLAGSSSGPRAKRKPLVAVVMNPPFKKAMLWFELVSEYADYVLVLLPQQYSRLSYLHNIPDCYELQKQEYLDDATFKVGGALRTVPSVLQLWRKRDNPDKRSEWAWSLPPTYEQLAIAEWRFAGWKTELHNAAPDEVCLYLDVNNGNPYRLKKRIVREGKVYTVGPVLHRDKDEKVVLRSTAMGHLVICSSERIAAQLIAVIQAAEIQPASGRTRLLSGTTSRARLRKAELAWLWISKRYPRRWRELLRQSGISHYVEPLTLCDFDRQLLGAL